MNPEEQSRIRSRAGPDVESNLFRREGTDSEVGRGLGKILRLQLCHSPSEKSVRIMPRKKRCC